MVINILIFIAGLAIYAGYGLAGLVYLLCVTAASYLIGLLIPKHRWLMWVSVALQAALLVAFKLPFTAQAGLIAPMGLSYFTLQIISYHADLYRGKYTPEKNILRYGLFVTYLPHLSVGPIERFDTMQRALDSRRMSWDGISHGSIRLVWGLFKKLVIAARAGVVVSAISADPAAYQGAYALLAVLLYAVQLYADFSGAMDMVLGGSELLGLKLSENFDRPYFSQSFREFWRRWHMTLGAFLREYVYIPLGGNRKGKLRKVLNLLVTFLVSGLWHGAQYLLWGLLCGIGVALGDKLKTRFKTLNRVGTFLAITLLWAFFVWPDTATALGQVLSIFTVFNYGALAAGIGALGLSASQWAVLGAAVLVLWAADIFKDPLENRFARLGTASRLLAIGLLGLCVLVFGMYGIGFDAQAFIYSRF